MTTTSETGDDEGEGVCISLLLVVKHESLGRGVRRGRWRENVVNREAEHVGDGTSPAQRRVRRIFRLQPPDVVVRGAGLRREFLSPHPTLLPALPQPIHVREYRNKSTACQYKCSCIHVTTGGRLPDQNFSVASLEGDLVRKWRKFFGLTLEGLGAACPAQQSRSRVSDIEAGRFEPQIGTLLNLVYGLEKGGKVRLGRTDAVKLSVFFRGPDRLDAARQAAARHRELADLDEL